MHVDIAAGPEPEDPVYVYDERGLRVPRRAGHHVRGASTPAVMEGGAKDVPLTQGIGVCKCMHVCACEQHVSIMYMHVVSMQLL